MRFLPAFTLLTICLLISGCKTSNTCDARGPSEICQIHHAYMNTEIIVNPKHTVLPSPEYIQARLRLFPHTYPFFLPDQCDKCAIYICDDCVRAEGEWKRQHGTGK